PSGRLSQIRLAVEQRIAKRAYEEQVRSLSKLREPASSLKERYALRFKTVHLLHTDYLSEIETRQRPLPFMIEWPLCRYRRAYDPLLKIKHGQQLLNLIVKIPLFLALEELGSNPAGKALVQTVEAEILARPPSDGTLLSCIENLVRAVGDK